MPIFKYKAYDNEGKEVKGEIDAPTKGEATGNLKHRGLYPREITEKGRHRTGGAGSSVAGTTEARGGRPPLLNLAEVGLFSRRQVSLINLAVFTRQLSTLLSSGATLHESLGLLTGEEENKELKSAIVRIKERIGEGGTLAGAMANEGSTFPELYISMVEAGEGSGTLDSVLMRLADYLEAKAKIQNEVSTALAYPVLMTLVGAGVLTFLFIYVLPKIVGIFEDSGRALPLITTVLLGIMEVLRGYWPLIIIVILALSFGIKRYHSTKRGKGRIDSMLTSTPVLGNMLRKFYTATFARTLGSLIESGVPILKAIEHTRGVVNNTSYKATLDKAVVDITEGHSLSDSLKSSAKGGSGDGVATTAGTVPGLLIHMIAIGERSGNLDKQLLKAAGSYEGEFKAALTRTLSLLEPLLILAMGLIVGFIVLAILLPIFELTQSIG